MGSSVRFRVHRCVGKLPPRRPQLIVVSDYFTSQTRSWPASSRISGTLFAFIDSGRLVAGFTSRSEAAHEHAFL